MNKRFLCIRSTEKPVQCAQAQSVAQLALEQLASPSALTPATAAFVHPAPLLSAPAIPAVLRKNIFALAAIQLTGHLRTKEKKREAALLTH
jgi:hypothetical protein